MEGDNIIHNKNIIACFVVLMITAFPVFSSSPMIESTVLELDISGRKVDIWSWPADGKSKGVILFSHGAFSAPWKYEELIHYWVQAGYDVYAPLHVDSTDYAQHNNYKGTASWKPRLEDIKRLADEFGNDGYIVAGHSYGAMVALTKGGAKAAIPERYTDSLFDLRVKLVIALSPPAAIPALFEKEAYGGLSVPALVQTGTQDILPPGSDNGWEGHLDAYEMAKAGGHRYALILKDVDHYFGGAICRPELPGPKQEKELEIAATISVLMMSAFFEHDHDALNLLQSQLSASGQAILKTK